jgi:two-component system sensor histidine kinase CpxA
MHRWKARSSAVPRPIFRGNVDAQEMEIFDMTLLLELSDHFTADAERRRTTIALEIDARVTIWGNVELMCRAIDNVLRNALHHGPDESGIDIRCNQHNGQVLLAIREWGEGTGAGD